MALVELLKLDIPQRCLDYPTLFTQIHGKLRRTENIARPCFDLNKHKCPLVQGNDIDFSVSRSVIPFQDSATLFNRKFRGTVLAGLAKRLF
jgi:hypothetical protein